MRSHEFYVLNLIKVLGASLVVASHYGGHFLGVDFYAFGTGAFFIVAGFYALNAETARGLHYLAKRLVRLYPGYLVAVGAYLLVRGIPSGDWPYLAGHHALFLLATPDVATVFSLNPAFWSLPVFFSFFLIVA